MTYGSMYDLEFPVWPASDVGFHRPSNICSPGQVLRHPPRRMDQTGQFLGQARHCSALVVLNTLRRIINLNITTLSYWPVHRVLEVAVALMSAVTPGELRLVVTEVHHSCQLMAP
jgi:hypothetical protein